MEPTDQTPAEAESPKRKSTGSFWSTLAAPWHFLHPGRAAQGMASGTRPAVCVSFGLGLTLLAAIIIGLVMWDDSVRRPGFYPGGDDAGQTGLAEVWRKWHARSWFGPAEAMLVCVWFLTPLAGGAVAWLLLSNVHQAGRGWASYGRAYRAVAAGVGVLNVLAVVIGFPIAAMSNWDDAGGDLGPETVIPFIVFCAACGCGLVYWLHRATLAVRGPEIVVPDLPPRCEGCGYDLTHQGAEGRCTECGLDLAESLTAVRRSGCRWQQSRHVDAWAVTTVSVIAFPARFYRRLQVRFSPEAADQFARWQYLGIGLYAAFACALGFLVAAVRFSERPPAAICLLPVLFSFLLPLICWLVHRFVGAAAASWFIVRDALPDVRWARVVMGYETAYLWTFCLYSSALILSFMMFDDWMSKIAKSIRLYPIGFMPIEVDVLFVGNIVLGLLLFRRYHVARMNIRWSNF